MSRLRPLSLFFLRLGATTFGGPAAHIAVMEQVVVRERGWLTRERFLDLLGAANLIPGPSSTELAIYIGYDQAGVPGLLAAGLCFILPAALITLAFAYAYVRFGALPRAAGALYGVKPVIVAVVAQALFRLGRAAVKSRLLLALGVLAFAAALLRADQLSILVAAGIAALLLRPAPPAAAREVLGLAPLPGPASALSSAWAAVAASLAPLAPASLTGLFLVFAKVGAVLFGSGYVLLALLREELVERLHWLTEGQLLDAIAVGQFTPGPIFTTATFIGYVLSGVPGALVATAGIFAPAFVLVAASGFIVPRLRRSARAGAFLDGVNVASLALMAAVSVDLGRAAFVDAGAVALALAAFALLARLQLNPAWLVLGGALCGVLMQRF